MNGRVHMCRRHVQNWRHLNIHFRCCLQCLPACLAWLPKVKPLTFWKRLSSPGMLVAGVGRGFTAWLLVSSSKSSSPRASLVTGSRPVSCTKQRPCSVASTAANLREAAYVRHRLVDRCRGDLWPNSALLLIPHLDDFEDEPLLVEVARVFGHHRHLRHCAADCGTAMARGKAMGPSEGRRRLSRGR